MNQFFKRTRSLISASLPVVLPSQARALTQRLKAMEKSLDDVKRSASEQKDVTIQTVLHAISLEPSILLWSPPKTGSTYLLNLYMNYVRGLVENTDEPLSRAQLTAAHSIEEGVIHGNLGEKLSIVRGIHGESLPFKYMVHTHTTPKDHKFDRVICLTRHPLDVVVSRYHFWYKNRGKKIEMFDIIEKEIPLFTNVYLAQRRYCNDNPHSSKFIAYEELTSQPLSTLQSLIEFLDYPLEQKCVEVAVRNSSKGAIKKLEDASGRPLIAGGSFQGSSFVRSGKVGEWKDAMTLGESDFAYSLIRSYGVEPDECWPSDNR